MAIERVSHSNLSTHSPPFSLVNGGFYTATVSGVAAGGDAVELQMFVNNQPMSLSKDMKFTPLDNGGAKFFSVPAGSLMRWTVPRAGAVHNANCNIVSSN
jgi:hypothetical protein